MTKYRASTHRISITPVELERETEHTVWLSDGRRENKQTSYHAYFDSYAEAKGWLIEIFGSEKKRAELRYDHAAKDLEKAEAL